MAIRRYSILLYLYSFSLFVLFLQSMQAWFLLYVNEYYTFSLSLILGTFYLLTRKGASRKISLSIPFFAIASYFWMRESPNIISGLFGGFLRLLPVVFFLILLNKDELKIILSVITKLFALLLGVSIFFYIIGFVYPIPSIGNIDKLGGYYDFSIHIFYLTNNKISTGILSERFMSVFLEPGFLGHICAFILYANDFKIKNHYNQVILLALIMSFSLAGYLLFAIGLLCRHVIFFYSRKKIKRLAYIFVLFVVFWSYGNFYNGGDNKVNELILSRLEYDNEKGIVGNTRTGMETDFIFMATVASGNIVKGLGTNYFVDRYQDEPMGAGVKIYLITRGIIGVILVFLFYLSLVLTGSNKRSAVGMLVVYVCAFLDVSYPFWSAWLIPFICVANGYPDKNIKSKEFADFTVIKN